MIIEELGKVLKHYKSIMNTIFLKKFHDGQAKRSALDNYDTDKCDVIEEEGIFERLGLWDKISELNEKKFAFPMALI